MFLIHSLVTDLDSEYEPPLLRMKGRNVTSNVVLTPTNEDVGDVRYMK